MLRLITSASYRSCAGVLPPGRQVFTQRATLPFLHPAIMDSTSCSGLATSKVARGRFKPMRGTGDSGQSSLFNNERRWKDDDVFNAVGTTDELTSYLGVCRESAIRSCLSPELAEVLIRVQCCLQDVSSHLATPPETKERRKKLTSFDAAMLEWLDGEIDRFSDTIPSLKQFILPGGGETAAALQYARTLARRAERSVVPLLRDEQIDPNALKFLNRLSDLLFVLGRYACMKTGNEELIYLRPKEFTQLKWQKKKLDEEK